ncbi:peroxisomal membrane protein [Malassezia pachydermatis]
MQERLLRDRVARENLRRRFLQNQEDCSFTIMALLPTLSTQIFEAMDVESISQELLAQNKKPASEVVAETPAPAAEASDATPTPGTADAAPPADDGAVPSTTAEATTPTSGRSTPRPQSLDLVSEQPPEPISATAKLPTASNVVSEEERRANKLRLWNQIKHVSFERTFTTLYTLVFLSLQTYIQLNLLGRRAYLAALENQSKHDAVMSSQDDGMPLEPHHITLHGDGLDDAIAPDSDADSAEGRLSQDTERKYLTSSYWFLHRGWQTVATDVRRAVHEELGDMPLKTVLTYQHVEALVERIRARLEHEPTGGRVSTWDGVDGFRNILLPESESDSIEMLQQAGALSDDTGPFEAITPQLRALLDETKDYIDSPDFAFVFRASCDRVFKRFVRSLAPSFGVRDKGPKRAEKSLLLAKVLPLVSQQAQVALTSSPNNYVESIVEGHELRALSVLIYAAWDDELDM